jgi:hypothetical protein
MMSSRPCGSPETPNCRFQSGAVVITRAGFSLAQGGLVIDLARMKGVAFDPAAAMATADAGWLA